MVWGMPAPDKPPQEKIRIICKEGVWHLQSKQWHSIGGYHWIDYHTAGSEEEVMLKLDELKQKVYNPDNGKEKYF